MSVCPLHFMKHHPPATRRPSFFDSRRMRALWLAIGTALLLPGCSSPQTSNQYTAVRVSTYRGEIIAEYIARGSVVPVEGGVKIHAVERRSGPPFSQVSRYPYGWDTTVVGPRIHHWPTRQPSWLDGGDEIDSFAK